MASADRSFSICCLPYAYRDNGPGVSLQRNFGFFANILSGTRGQGEGLHELALEFHRLVPEMRLDLP